VRELLHIWPDLALFIDFFDRGVRPNWSGDDRLDNVTDALEHRDRVCKIRLTELTCSEFERIMTVMQGPFPALTSLILDTIDGALPQAIPDTVLNGSAPIFRMSHFVGLVISIVINNPLVCKWPYKSSTLRHTEYLVHFTRVDGHMSVRLDNARNT
jgi:hypothetical protein